MKEQYRTRSLFIQTMVLIVIIAMVIALSVGCSQTTTAVTSSSTTTGSTTASTTTEATTTATTTTVETTSETSKSSGWISDEPIVFTMMYNDNPNNPIRDDWPTLVELKKLTNVDLQITIVPGSDYAQKLQIVLNSGDVPDLIGQGSSINFTPFALNGTLLPVSDYLDKMPNLKNLITDWNMEPDLKKYTLLDGKWYFYPFSTEKLLTEKCLFIREDLLTEYSLQIPKTFDDLYNVLKVFKEKNPESQPITNLFGEANFLSMICDSFETIAGWELGIGFDYIDAEDKWIYAPTSENYRTLLRYVNKLLNEGLLDQEAFTIDLNTWQTKLSTGKSFATYAWYNMMTQLNITGKESVSPDYQMIGVVPLAGPTGVALSPMVDRLWIKALSPASVSEKPYFDDFMKFVDWMYYSEEGNTLFLWGVEGISYEIVDGKKQFLPDIQSFKNPNGKTRLDRDIGCWNNNFGALHFMEWEAAKADDRLNEFYDTMINNNMIKPINPVIIFTAEEIEQVGLMTASLNDYTNQSTLQFIFGQKSLDNDWDSYVNEFTSKGLDELRTLVESAWARQNG